MYVSHKASFVRNVAAALINGIITLIILLIAPLGLAAVIVNTGLVAFSTFAVATGVDWIVLWLLRSSHYEHFSFKEPRRQIRYYSPQETIDFRPNKYLHEDDELRK